MTVNFDSSVSEKLETWLSFGLERYHESWKRSWGQTIRSEEIRAVISETPRLATRLQEQVLEEVRSVLLGNRRDFDSFPSIDASSVSRFIEQAGARLIRKTGLAWYSNSVKQHLTGPGSHELMDQLGKDAIRAALVFSNRAPVLQQNYRVRELVPAIDRDGLFCLLNWTKQFPNDVAVRLAVLLPRPKPGVEIPEDADGGMAELVTAVLTPEKNQ